MKILQVNCVYGNGSTGKIVQDIHNYFVSQNIESVVCYGRGNKIKEKNVYKICSEFESKVNHLLSYLTGIKYGGYFFSNLKLKEIIKKEKPDIVHLHCINGYFLNIYEILSWLAKKKFKTIITLHAEFMYTGNCGISLDCKKWETGCGNCPRLKEATNSLIFDKTKKAWKKMKKAFEKFNNNLIIVSVSEWLKNRAIKSPILCDRYHKVIYNGLNCNIFHFYENNYLLNNKSFKNRVIIFHATPFFSNDKNNLKGGYFIERMAQKFSDKNVLFVVAGPVYKKNDNINNIIFLGKINNQNELAKYYSLANVTLLTSKIETFSMVTAESLCCGTPVVGFQAGAPEQIAIKEFSEFVEYGNEDLLYNAINSFLNKKIDKKIISNISKKKYSKETMCSNYLATYKELENK